MGTLVRAKQMPFGPEKKEVAHNPGVECVTPSNWRHFFFAQAKGPMGPGPEPMASCSVLLYYYAFILYYYIILYIILYILYIILYIF